jgi:GNAT superfamily N-acetyltransferase
MIVDHELVQRVEDAIAAERSAFADGMAVQLPNSTASWMSVAGGRAIFTGSDFFTNRAIAMGLRGPVSRGDIEHVETFYAERGVPSEIEIASLADRSLIRLLSQLGYQLIRFRNIYVQRLSPHSTTGMEAHTRSPLIEVHQVDASTASAWSQTLQDGFEYTTTADRKRIDIWNQMLLSLPGLTPLIAVLAGKPVGSASVLVVGSTAMLGGAATLPVFRRQGVQRALIEARLAVATQAGCELAVVTADPGSSSGRNAERTGFQLMCNHVGMRARAAHHNDEGNKT